MRFSSRVTFALHCFVSPANRANPWVSDNMSIVQFFPVSATIGGIAIGAAATMLLALNGRIAGISGIMGGLIPPRGGDIAWRLAFLTGLILGALAVDWADTSAAPIQLAATPPTLIAAGLLVGWGTRLGGGCTSGHGVCGIARLSRRSLMATALFIASATITVFIVRHVMGG
jgi:uncharacterized protein